eukprot:3920922-Rhodomonas_salina.1
MQAGLLRTLYLMSAWAWHALRTQMHATAFLHVVLERWVLVIDFAAFRSIRHIQFRIENEHAENTRKGDILNVGLHCAEVVDGSAQEGEKEREEELEVSFLVPHTLSQDQGSQIKHAGS